MPRGENLSKVDRAAAGRKGGLARAEKLRSKREEAEEKLAEHVDKAVTALAEALDDPDSKVRAAAQILDRTLGRAIQRTEFSGRLEIDVTQARDKLDSRLADRAARLGQKRSSR